MFLDERLLQINAEQKKQEKIQEHLQKVKEGILKQEREQKSVEDRICELNNKAVEINGKIYLCEKKKVLNNHISIFILPEDVDRLFEENNVATVFYRTLEIGTNITYLNQSAVIKNQKEFQVSIAKQYLKEKLTYHPLETGVIVSGKYKICFAEGVVNSAVGGVFINNFYCSGKKRTITGNYTCRLMQRYTFGNLFRAMLSQMFEEDK